jgi:two-component system cell cycle sensor histidine kinase/response regulator CckA
MLDSLGNLADFLPECIRIISKEGIVLEINTPGLFMLEADSKEQVVGRPIYDFVVPEYRDGLRKFIEESVKAAFSERLAKPHLQYEYQVLTLKGNLRFVNSIFMPLYNADCKEVSSLIVITSDVTEKRQLELYTQHVSKLESIGRLAGGVAHDFNNILTVIGGYSELILSKLEKDNRVYNYVLEIKKAVDRASWLTSQLLAFSRKSVIRYELVNLNTVISDMLKMLGRIVGEDIKIVTLLEPSLKNILSDRGHIEQIIMNLSVNAREAMPKGGSLTFVTRNVCLPRRYMDLNSGEYVVLEVRDTGCGIPKEVLPHIFEPYFTTKKQGTGLGLSTVYGIVKQMRGHIEVRSEPGKGTAFIIYFPASGQQDTEDRSPSVTSEGLAVLHAPETGVEATILVVEDDTAVRHYIAEVLEEKGFRVFEAGRGKDACILMEGQKITFNLLITDVVLPDMDSGEIEEYARRLFPDIGVIYISGYADRVNIGNLANKHFIQKPFSSGDLLTMVQRVLGEIV